MQNKKLIGIGVAFIGLIGCYYYIGGYLQLKNDFGNIFGAADDNLKTYWPMMVISIAASLFGLYLLVKDNNKFTNFKNEGKQLPEVTNFDFGIFNGEKSLNSDSYKIFLVKKFGIEKNEALGKFICDNKLFTTIDEALAHANNLDKNLTEDTTPQIIEVDLSKEDKPKKELQDSQYSDSQNERESSKSDTNLNRNILIIGSVLLLFSFVYIFSKFNLASIDFPSLRGKPTYVLFDTKSVSHLIEKKVGKDNVAYVKLFFEVSGNLKTEGDFLVGTGCMRHQCSDKSGLIFINFNDSDVVIVTTSVLDSKFTAYGIDINKAMPPSAKSWLRENNIRIK